jgi:hypothetical protein
MSSRDVTNGLKAYTGRPAIGLSCSGVIPRSSELSFCAIHFVLSLT